MYSDQNRRASVSRANDEFLRRMLGGELTGGVMPVMNMETPAVPRQLGQGSDRLENRRNDEGDLNSQRGRLSGEGIGGENCRPSCDGNYDCGSGNGNYGDCPTQIHAPSLAMVYAPRQCWRNLLDPQSALESGSLFAELIMPLEVARNSRETEGKGRKC